MRKEYFEANTDDVQSVCHFNQQFVLCIPPCRTTNLNRRSASYSVAMTSLTGRGEKPPSSSQNQSVQLAKNQVKSVKGISNGILKRLKDASVANCNTSTEYATDFSHAGARIFHIQSPPTVPCSQEGISRSTSETWSMIINNFEHKYTGVYIQSEMKKKAHLDCIEGSSGSLVHEPKEKWCHVLLLDAIVHSAHQRVFTPLGESSVRRRKFNQHLELKNSILEHYGMSTTPNTYDPHQCSDGHVTPDVWDSDQIFTDQLSESVDSLSPRPSPFPIFPDLTNMDYETLGVNSVSPRSESENTTRKRKFAENFSCKENIGDAQLCENMYHLLSDSHQTKFESDCEDFGNFGFSKRPPHPWDSHGNLRNYLLSLAGTGKSSKRFANVVNDLCQKLATHETDMRAETNTNSNKCNSPATMATAMTPTSLMDIVALVIGKVVDSPMLEHGDGFPSDEIREGSRMKASAVSTITPTLPDFDFYTIGTDFIQQDEIKSHYSNYECGGASLPPYEHTLNEHMRAKKIEYISDNTGLINDCNSCVHFIIPTDLIHSSEDDLEHADLGNHVACGAQSEDFAKVPSPLFPSSDINRNPLGGDFAFLSLDEMWDDNYEA